METKPVFCSECGAKLTGSAIFCSKCGAKQQAATSPAAEVVPAPVAEPVPEVVPAPVVEPVPEVVPVAAPDPVPEVKPAPAPVSAPANALPRKAKLSVFGLLVAVLALGATLLANILTIVNFAMVWGNHFSDVAVSFLTNNTTSMFVALLIPFVTLVIVFVKNKPLAAVGLILAILSLAMQFLLSIVYFIAVQRGFNQAIFNILLRFINGEALFLAIQQLFRAIGRNGRAVLQALPNLFASLLFFAKNLLAAFACLAVLVKRKK